MSWDAIKNLSAGRPRLTALITAVSLAGAGISAITNASDLSELLTGKAKIEAKDRAELEAREVKAIQLAQSAAVQQKATEVDASAWTTAVTTNTTEAFDFYLKAFPTGQFRAQAEEAKAKLASAPVRSAAFSLSQLHPTVAAAVTTARTMSRQADAKQAEGERAANQAEAEALRARSGAPAHDVVKLTGGARFEGQVDRRKPNGLGVYLQAGEVFKGQHVDGRWSGVGVYENPAPTGAKPRRYGGEVQTGRLSGVGVAIRADGARESGAVVDGLLNGYGALAYSDGRRLEGEFKSGAPNGYGVLWSADGRILEAGRYENGTLVQRLSL